MRAPPAEPPISVSKRLAITRNSRIASWVKRVRRQAEGLVGEVDAVDQDRLTGGVAAGADHRAVLDEAEAAALALDAGRDEGQPLEVADRAPAGR